MSKFREFWVDTGTVPTNPSQLARLTGSCMSDIKRIPSDFDAARLKVASLQFLFKKVEEVDLDWKLS